MNVHLSKMNPHLCIFSHCSSGLKGFSCEKGDGKKSNFSDFYSSQNKIYNKFSPSVLQPDLCVCFLSTDKERIRQQRGACIPSEEDLHIDSCWGGTETGTAGEIHAGWYVFHVEPAFFSRHRLHFDLSYVWIAFPATLAVAFVRFWVLLTDSLCCP